MNPLLLAQTWLVVVTGLGGTPQHRAAFDRHASAIVAGAVQRLGVPAENVVVLGERTSPRSTADEVVAALTRVASSAPGDATIVIILIGHGSAQGGEPRINLPGPDLTAGRLAEALRVFRTQEVVVVNGASSSGPWVAALAGPRRTVIAATRSASERFETVFPRFLAEAFSSPESDLDHDDRLSVLELFEFTRRAVERHYREERRLPTEHALLDDNGDGAGALAPGADSTDGRRAALLHLGGGGSAAGATTTDGALRALLARRDSLERALAELRSRRAAMDSAAYENDLERLLLELSRTGRSIRERQEPRP